MSNRSIYADNAATTPLNEAALAAMLPFFGGMYGNPSAQYPAGAEAKSAVEKARRTVATAIGAKNNEIYFTSGGTESDNWALLGVALLKKQKGRHIITAETEHSAVYKTTRRMQEEFGCEVTFLPVDGHGAVRPEALEAALREDTVLVSLMLANNEVGTIQPIRRLSDIAHKRGVLFHTDAVQAVGHVPVDVRELGVDLLSMSAHKFGGPKGVGALYVRYGRTLPPLLTGGGQEKGGRSGTTNVPGVVGMAEALRLAVENLEANVAVCSALRERLTQRVLQLPGARLTGDPENRLPGLASFVFDGCGANPPLVSHLGAAGVFASAGSSCSAGSGDPSRVLLAMGLPGGLAGSSLRFSFGEQNTPDEVDAIADILPGVLQRVKDGNAHVERVYGMGYVEKDA